jgi:3-hydroxyacyl-[acyl-carrier-protein] dehydratase
MLNNLFTLIKKEDDSFSIKLADATHPIFKAHFPSNPLLPGFILIEIFSQVLECEINEIKKAKFTNPALPNDELDFFIKDKKVIIRKNNQKVAEIVYA